VLIDRLLGGGSIVGRVYHASHFLASSRSTIERKPMRSYLSCEGLEVHPLRQC
jgi:hypothetical protein